MIIGDLQVHPYDVSSYEPAVISPEHREGPVIMMVFRSAALRELHLNMMSLLYYI